MPVLALPRHPGRHHDLGALGQPAPRRHPQPRRHDLLQPLRARRGRRLAAPHRRRSGGVLPRLPHHPLRPRPGGGLTWAKARHETPYGTAAISWQLTGEVLTAELTVPPGCQAVLELPDRPHRLLGPGTHRVSTAEPGVPAPHRSAEPATA
ncbi:alpha-L-rhamnosidase C-terminal domain-containing protein [Kitasatospora saccharophila]|uniref:alpha-L-rhamnosidase C-terminal domain-containing protein n=1 Tax=Kitasatospora saccharophila TaxID=407973 RepID=UPI00362905F7